MIKEVKTKETQTAQPVNSNKKYIALALVVILAVIGIVMNNSSNEEETIAISTTGPEKVTATATEEQKPQEEHTTARIDISTKLVDADKPQFEVYVDDSETPLEQADWMTKFNAQGNVVQKKGNNVNINIKALTDAKINIFLKGPWKQDEDHNMVENWVKYTSLTIDGEDILSEAVEVWHNKPFRHTINAKAGEEYKIHAEWTKPDTIPEE